MHQTSHLSSLLWTIGALLVLLTNFQRLPNNALLWFYGSILILAHDILAFLLSDEDTLKHDSIPHHYQWLVCLGIIVVVDFIVYISNAMVHLFFRLPCKYHYHT